MAKEHLVRVATEISAPAATVWARVSNHEDTPSWVGAVKSVTIVREGKPRNGLGAVRLVVFRPRFWAPVHEEITHFDPPHAFHYVLFKGMPALKSHLGKVIVDDLGNGRARLRWEVDFLFEGFHPFRVMVPSVIKNFEDILVRALATLKTQLESEPTQALA